ncbi:MAG TPA: cation:proton antiporter [Gemmatimonadales bacterium]|nr:cation:proton antiporter [Gemmatimonadales bacterium]
MPDAHDFVANLALVLCVAAATTLVCQRLRQPVVFGYLLAGMIVGPHLPIPLVADEAMVQALSELGVILLMFALGLEFSLRKFFRVGPTAGLIAVSQSGAMVFLGYVLGRAFGWTALESVYAGAVIAISSTTIIVKAFAEQKVTGRFTEIVFGVLIIEDLVAIFLLAILTAVSAGGGVGAGVLLKQAGLLAAFLVGFVVVGLLLIPRVVRFAARLGSPETTLVTAVGVCFGGAVLAHTFGYSVALGAFIAGSLVAESGEATTIEHLVAPVRDVFGAIFFVAVGMLIDPRLVAEHWVAVLVLSLVVIAGKVVAVSVSTFLTGFGTRTAVQTGMSLAQIGEFSFIIAGVGLTSGATRDFLYPVAVAVSAITTLTTPWLIRAAGPVASYVDRRLPHPLQNFAVLYETWLARLRETRAGKRSRVRRLVWLLLLDAGLVAALAIGATAGLDVAAGWASETFGLGRDAARQSVLIAAAVLLVPLLYGLIQTVRALVTALAVEVLPPAAAGQVDTGAAPRRALVVAMELAVLCALGIPLLAVTEPFLPPLRGPLLFGVILVFLAVALWRSATDLEAHTRAGAELIAAALARQMAPDPPTSDAAIPDVTTADARTSESEAAPVPMPEVGALLPGLGEPVVLRLNRTDWGVGKTLAELDVRSLTGAAILAVDRDGRQVLLPHGQERLQAGDALGLAGTPEAIAAATALLQRGG